MTAQKADDAATLPLEAAPRGNIESVAGMVVVVGATLFIMLARERKRV